MNKLSYILAISILPVVGCGSLNVPNQPSGLPVSCHNAQYGLTFFLPSDWRGYSVLIQKWDSGPASYKDAVAEHGPIIVLRHPQWHAADPRQDILIMVFTRGQWEAEKQGKFFPYAGGVIDEMWHNRQYVFGQYSRNYFSELNGWQEAADIVSRNCAAYEMPHLHPQ